MFDVVAFLEEMGCNAQWRHASEEDIQQALAETGVDASVRSAILAKDASRIAALLGQSALIGMLTPQPEPDEDDDDDEEEGERPDGAKQASEASGAISSTSLSLQ